MLAGGGAEVEFEFEFDCEGSNCHRGRAPEGIGGERFFFWRAGEGGAASSSLVPRLGSEILAGGGAEEFEFEFEGSS